MRSKSYALLLIASAAIVFLSVAAANVIIDPWGVFGATPFSTTNINDRYGYFREYEAAPDRYDGLLLSSSRGRAFQVGELSRQMGNVNFADFRVSYGRLEDHLAVLDYVLRDKAVRGKRLKAIFLLVDVESFGERPAAPGALQLLQPPAISGGTSLRFWWKNLMAIQFDAWRRTVRAWRTGSSGPTAKPSGGQATVQLAVPAASEDSRISTTGIEGGRSAVPAANEEGRIFSARSVGEQPGAFAANEQGAMSSVRIVDRPRYGDDMRNWARIAALCRDNDVMLMAVLSPIFPGQLVSYDSADLDHFARQLGQIAPIWDFSFKNEPSNRLDFWSDNLHFVPIVANMMLKRIVGDDLPTEWKGFGQLRRPDARASR